MSASNEVGSVAASRRALVLGDSEATWQDAIMETLAACGWVAFHINASVVRVAADGRHRHATAVTRAGKGFPDVIALRGQRMVLIEAKTQRGVVSAAQRHWHHLLVQVPGVEVYVLRPSDVQQLTEIAI